MILNRNIDIYGQISLEDHDAEWDVSVETYPAEPFTWGGSRGNETAVEVKFHGLKIGAFTVNRERLIEMFGLDAVKAAEDDAHDHFSQLAKEGEIE